MRIIGADVSHWEGVIDWSEAARWLGFVYFKCTDGVGGVDPTFEANRKGCEQSGMPHAPFHYYQPGQDPTTQADHFIDVAGRNFKRYIVDVEERFNVDDHITASILSFCLRVAAKVGVRPAIYTSPGYWDEIVIPHPTWAQSYDLAVAHYTAAHQPTLPVGWSAWTMWQFSDHFFFPGCSSPADGDWFNGTLTQCREYFGNYHQVEPVTYSLRARSFFDQLHVREKPSTLAKELGHLSKGDVVEIDELGGNDVWVHHSQGSPAGNPGGWTCVEKSGYRYMEVVK